jgi:hypothetical protein
MCYVKYLGSRVPITSTSTTTTEVSCFQNKYIMTVMTSYTREHLTVIPVDVLENTRLAMIENTWLLWLAVLENTWLLIMHKDQD